jgi:hypothetical protein
MDFRPIRPDGIRLKRKMSGPAGRKGIQEKGCLRSIKAGQALPHRQRSGRDVRLAASLLYGIWRFFKVRMDIGIVI